MTSAPRSARMVVATGPAMKLALSMTRTPSSKGIAEARSARAALGRRRALAQQPQRQQGHADADRGVRHVEGRPVQIGRASCRERGEIEMAAASAYTKHEARSLPLPM